LLAEFCVLLSLSQPQAKVSRLEVVKMQTLPRRQAIIEAQMLELEED